MFESSKGLGAKLDKNGKLAWGYLFSIPCDMLMLDSKQENGFFVLNFPNRGLELHEYNLKTGTKNYLYEYQLADIDTVTDGIYYNDYYWIIGNQKTNICFILKISKTRRHVYLCPSTTKMWSIVFPTKNPVIVGTSGTNEPFLIQISDDEFKTTKSVKLSGVKSSDMQIRKRFEEDEELIWALSSSDDKSVHVTRVNVNTTSVRWTKKYNQKLSNVNIAYTHVFEEYLLVGKDTTLKRTCFMRFKHSGGEATFMFCTASGNNDNYNIYPSTLHLDPGSSLFIGGQLKLENFYFYRTGVELGDRS